MPTISPHSYKPDEILELVEMKQLNQLEMRKCDKTDAGFNIDCPSCRYATIISLAAFKEEEEREKQGIVATGKSLRPAGWLLIITAAIFAPPIIFVLMWVLSGGSLAPIIWAVTWLGVGGAMILALVLYALAVILCFLFLARRLPIWLVPCNSCNLQICITISSGNAYILRKKQK